MHRAADVDGKLDEFMLVLAGASPAAARPTPVGRGRIGPLRSRVYSRL